MARRSARAEERRERRLSEASASRQPPWKLFRVPVKPLELIDEEGLARIDEAAFRILEESGLEFQNDRALDILERHRAKVDRSTGVARFDRGLIRECLAKAPSQFTFHARNPERNLPMGGNVVCFSPVGGPPNIYDLDKGRRHGSYQAQCDMIKLHQCLNVLHMAGGTPVEAIDLPVDTRHLDLYRAQAVYSDRLWWARGIGRARALDAVNVAALARGVSLEQLVNEPSVMTVVNVNSPRRVDGPLLEGLYALYEYGQPCVITPFTLAGAMAPVTIAGALAQQTAEALGLIALTQMVRPGGPVVMGSFTSNVDMRSGAPAFGTPEYVQGTIISGQIARRWKLPYRASNATSSNCVDVQAAQESMMSLWACVLSHVNIVHHSTGWLEGGLTASPEKSILDADMIASLVASFQPLDLSADALAVDAIKEVPTGGHFFGTAHTIARYSNAFHGSFLADLRPYETWAEDGAKTATERANKVWKSLLESYEEPPMVSGAKEAIDDYIARRKAEITAKGL